MQLMRRTDAPSWPTAFVLAAIVLTGAVAQARTALLLTPSLVDLTVKPGETATREIIVANSGDAAVTMRPLVWDWTLGPDGKRIALPPGGDRPTIVPWITVWPKRVVVEPRQSAKLLVTVWVPKQAATGGQAMLFVETDRTATGQTAMAMGVRLGAQILVSTGGETALRTRITRVVPPAANTPLEITVEVVNDGPGYTWVDGVVELLGPLQDFVGQVLPTHNNRLLVLPGEARQLEFEWGGALVPSNYEAIATVYAGASQATVTSAMFTVRDPQAPPGVDPAMPVEEIVHVPAADAAAPTGAGVTP